MNKGLLILIIFFFSILIGGLIIFLTVKSVQKPIELNESFKDIREALYEADQTQYEIDERGEKEPCRLRNRPSDYLSYHPPSTGPIRGKYFAKESSIINPPYAEYPCSTEFECPVSLFNSVP